MQTMLPPQRGKNYDDRAARLKRWLKDPSNRWRIVGLSVSAALLAGLWFLATLPGLPDPNLPTLKQAKSGVALYDRNGKWVCTAQADRDKQPVPLSKVSMNVRNAILAAEDSHFFSHEGIDPSGIMRALWANFKAGRIVEGGSTITQQLVRNLYLDKNDVSLQRKLKEALLAMNVDSRYSKAKILETYLNEVYFGGGVYGIERAAQRYFNKHAKDLNVAESAYLAGVIRAPSVLGAPQNEKTAMQRQRYVIGRMAEFDFITPDQAREAYATELAFQRGPHLLRFPHYMTNVLRVLENEVGEELWKKDWRVYTNLDVKAQALAEKTLNAGIKRGPRGINQGALVTMSLKDGGVLAIVGGVGRFEHNEWNRAVNPHTAGSAIKPFVYLAALMHGTITPETMVADEPIVIQTKGAPPWSPKNFDGEFKGMMTARQALATSRNVCAVRIGQATGMQNVVNTARRAGIREARMEPYPALSVGYAAISPLEMTTAYATLARGGVYMEPQFIRRIEDADGNLVKRFDPKPETRFPKNSVAQLVSMMQDVVQRGTGLLARLPGLQVAGKTGTADGGKDIWFVGFTPDTVTGVWGGNDLNKNVPGRQVTGGVVMAKMWHDFMTGFYKFNKPPVGLAFDRPISDFYASTQNSDLGGTPVETATVQPQPQPNTHEIGNVVDQLVKSFFQGESEKVQKRQAEIEFERPVTSGPVNARSGQRTDENVAGADPSVTLKEYSSAGYVPRQFEHSAVIRPGRPSPRPATAKGVGVYGARHEGVGVGVRATSGADEFRHAQPAPQEDHLQIRNPFESEERARPQARIREYSGGEEHNSDREDGDFDGDDEVDEGGGNAMPSD